jgi:hypothetical protein
MCINISFKKNKSRVPRWHAHAAADVIFLVNAQQPSGGASSSSSTLTTAYINNPNTSRSGKGE